MAQQTRTVNKAALEDGDTATGAIFTDLIDSYLSLADSTAQTITSRITVPVLIATTEVCTPVVDASTISCDRFSADMSARFLGRVRVCASADFHQNLRVSGNITVGPPGELGAVQIIEAATIIGSNTAAAKVEVGRLPPTSYIHDWDLTVHDQFCSSGWQSLHLGTSAAATAFGQIQNISANANATASGLKSMRKDGIDVSGDSLVTEVDTTVYAQLAVSGTGGSAIQNTSGHGIIAIRYAINPAAV